ncbi:hypothetical protein AVEN_102735-1 [Araneus ventricosus]|uniref:Uncharacterized protein n=1 Tax=Araneus ventricosus TaxID=182803 RepID=A0A4Y2NXA0_ARAVE|nr:hypothetical protein AVEN_255832-1 [Araneus ventricosus]GBN42605.1 hypothetical protein AVEN_102735-1 [Araneus ventricosus]
MGTDFVILNRGQMTRTTPELSPLPLLQTSAPHQRDECISFPDIDTANIETISHPGSSRRAGRPQKDFGSCSTKTKRRRINHILGTSSQEEISMAAEVQIRREGKRDSAAIVKELCDFSPRRGTTIKKSEEVFFKPKAK